MKIQVTQEHIGAGKRGCGDWCPIALAMKDAGFSNVYVGSVVTSAHLKDQFVTLTLSLAARSFVEDFDSGKPVEPMELDLFEAGTNSERGGP